MGTVISKIFLDEVNSNIGIAHKVCNIYFDQGQREDAFQEMMYQLWRAYQRFDGRSKFSTWMYSVCLNTALTWRRKNSRARADHLDDVHYQVSDESNANKDEEVALLMEAIGTLSPLNKAIVLLYLDGMSYDEIASVTGISRSNVSVRLVRIKKELETILKPKIKS